MRDNVLLVFSNLGSWTLTALAAVSLADIGALVGIAAGLGSVAVSVFSILWIRKQMAKADATK